MLGGVPVDVSATSAQNRVLPQHAVLGEDAGEVPQHAVEHVGEDRERLLVVVDDRADARDAVGQRAGRRAPRPPRRCPS